MGRYFLKRVLALLVKDLFAAYLFTKEECYFFCEVLALMLVGLLYVVGLHGARAFSGVGQSVIVVPLN